MFKEIARKLGGGCPDGTVTLHYIPVGTPSHGGFYEVHHREITRTFKAMLQIDRLEDFEEMASVAAFKVNSHRPGGVAPSPFAQLFGYEPRCAAERLPLFAFRRPAPEGDDKENIMADMLAMRRAHYAKMFDEHFRETRLATAVRKKLPEPHPRPLALGDLVLVRRNRGKIMRKFESPWEGPHRVVEIHASGVVVEEKEGLYFFQEVDLSV